MMTVLVTTLPVFGLIFCGAAGQRFKLLPKDAVSGLNAFVFYFALPCMLFRVVASASPKELLDWRFACSYIVAGLILFQLGRWTSRCLWANNRPESYARGTAVAHGNIGYMGLALVGELLGPKALPIVAIAILCDVFTVMGGAIVLYERNQVREAGGAMHLGSIMWKVIQGLLKSPIVMSLLVGLVWLAFEFPLPKVLDNFTRLLAAAAGTCALFAIGASLDADGLKLDRQVWSMIGLKLVVHPIILAMLMYWVFNVDPLPAAIGILCASLPGASNTFIVAQRYKVRAELLSNAIVAGTFVAVITVSLCIWLLNLKLPS
jgi:malonate transporter and related proteins